MELSRSPISPSHSFLDVFADDVAPQRHHVEVCAVTTAAMASFDRLPDEDTIFGGSGIDRADNTTVERDNGVDEGDVEVRTSPYEHIPRKLTSRQFLLLRPFETADTDDHE